MANGNRLVQFFVQTINASGNVLPGSKAEFFTTQTTTPRTVFADADLTVPRTQPVISDGAGVFPETFLDGTPYRVVLTDADDVQIGVFDPVYGTVDASTLELNFQTIVESFTATAGQTVFNLSNSYVPGNNQLQVYINGVYQATPANYTESSTTSFTLTSGAEAGDIVVAIIGTPVSTTNTIFNSVTLADGADLTIAGGVITATNSSHRVDTEALAATDDLDTINGFTNGKILVLRSVDSARTVVVKNGTGNLIIGSDFPLNNVSDRIELIGTSAGWVQLSRSDNA